ncbi:flagellar motor protein MotB [Halopseudomonas phragmitis]|uniref:OmpA-like domain-containing protein n=1 Tax=Halopseudomonas phragmitis TaxID=1931241 RepID=A0A1V0B1G4_9GAMM|nr:flagellar motor protein MotB [Halopseudomonas phragmitis]AQZ93745.1 hypothetical protein BVH74_02760 [Halopseudomonas phragmitis]
MKKRGANHDEITIVKRKAKKDHDDEHSGAWKVAFADFTMAMMALFMVLWLVQAMKNEEAAKHSSEALASPVWEGGAGIFDGTSPLLIESLGDSATVSVGDEPPAPARSRQLELDSREHLGLAGIEELQSLAELMREMAEAVNAEANLEVEVVPQGLRILVKDDQQRFMFQRGSAVLNPHFHALLGRLAAVLGRVDNKLIISGHTDATPYRGGAGYNNWNLSGDRALRARNVLVEAGLPGAHILQVTAQADGMLLRPDEPESGANRRIELLLLTIQAETLYQELFGERTARVDYSEQGAEYREGTESL